jgi:hypothetical protein
MPRLLLLAALTVPGLAAAQPVQVNPDRPWYVFAQQAVEYQSNALNSEKGSEVSDTLWTTTLGGGVSARFGRQRAYGNATVSHSRYTDIDGLDGQSYNLDAGLEWATIGNLSGRLTAAAGRRQADFGSGINTATLKNNETFEEVGASALLGGIGLLGIEGSVGARRVRFSAPEFASREYDQGSASAGVRYRPSSILTLGAGLSMQASDYDVPSFGQTQPDSNERRDVYVFADWNPTGASNLGMRLNFGKTDYDRATGLDFSGVTGSAYWRWRPTGRTSTSVTFTRDTGQESGFQRLISGDRTRLTATDFSRLTNLLALGATYDLTGKIRLTGYLSYARRTLVDSLTEAKGTDDTTVASLSADWAATRIITVGCLIGYESRSGSTAIPGSFDYSGNRFGCMGRVTLD